MLVKFDGKHVSGYVNLGTDTVGWNADPVPATNSLVFLLTAVNQGWKLPCAYFFTHGMSGTKLASLVRMCLEKCYDVGADVISLVCDGPPAHFSMARELGASLKADDLQTVIPHPSDPRKRFYMLLDAVHMLKVLRSCLEALGVIVDGEGRRIEWRYFEELLKLQTTEGLRLANKLRERHIKFKSCKMKVNLCAQLFSLR